MWKKGNKIGKNILFLSTMKMFKCEALLPNYPRPAVKFAVLHSWRRYCKMVVSNLLSTTYNHRNQKQKNGFPSKCIVILKLEINYPRPNWERNEGWIIIAKKCTAGFASAAKMLQSICFMKRKNKHITYFNPRDVYALFMYRIAW